MHSEMGWLKSFLVVPLLLAVPVAAAQAQVSGPSDSRWITLGTRGGDLRHLEYLRTIAGEYDGPVVIAADLEGF